MKQIDKYTRWASVVIVLLTCSQWTLAQDAEWKSVTGEQVLTDFVSGRKVSWEEGTASNWGEYRADGTGTLHAWGTEFDRNWEIKGDKQICFSGEPENQCITLERSTSDPSLYRITNVATGNVTEIRDANADGASVVAGATGAAAASTSGGPASASAEEMGKKLLNPANPIMKIGNNFDFALFDGELDGASSQTQVKYVFLTVFPFKLKNGNSILFRPGIPIIISQGVPNSEGGFDNVGVDLADMAFDLMYSGTTKKGIIWGAGMVGTIPIATDNRLGKKLWALGPEVLFGKASKKYVIGGVLGHKWDVGGSGTSSINVTTLNYFYGVPLKKGWAVQAAPVARYDHNATQGQGLTLPLAIGMAKTVALGKRPWQFRLEYSYNAVRPDAFAVVHNVRFGIVPVISAPWNKGK